MKKCFNIFLAAMFLKSQLLFAALNNPPTSVEKQFLGWKNELANPGFEGGKTGWTVTTTAFTVTTTSGEVFEGQRAAEWNPAGAESLKSSTWAVPAGGGGNAVGFCRVRSNADADYDIEIYDITAGAVVNERDIGASTSYANYPVNFIAVGGTSYRVQVTSAGDDDEIQVDSCGIGYAEGYNVSSVSQATFVGAGYFAGTASCAWSRTNTSPGDFTADTDCPAPTIITNPGPGTISTTDDNLPQFTVNNLPPGIYEVSFNAAMAMAAGAYSALGISDGIASTQELAGYNASTTTNENVQVSRVFTYTSTGNRTFKLQTYASSGAVTIDGANYTLGFKIRRFPTSSEQAYTPDLTAQSWSGYHDSTCSWARTNTAYGDPTADASCALVERTNQNFGTVSTTGSVLPGITFTPKKAGRYFVCASALWQTGALAQGNLRLLDNASNVIDVSSSTITTGGYLDTAKLCGIISVTSTAAQTLKIQTASNTSSVTIAASLYSVSAVEWSIVSIDQSLPAPVLTNMVTTPTSGGVRICSGYIANAGTPSVTRSDGNCLSGPVDNGTGDTTLTIAAGTFSSTPNCTCTGMVSAGQSVVCAIDSTTATSATTVRVQTTTVVPADFDADFIITCIGAR